jgi:hypothetical protein
MLIPLALIGAVVQTALYPPYVSVEVDSAKHRVVLHTAIECSMSPTFGQTTHQHATTTYAEPWLQFRWPVDGWLRGFRLSVTDTSKRLLPRSRIHHLVLANLDRRQLVHRAAERLFAIGQETPDVILPKSVGVPLRAGTHLALKAACQGDSQAEYKMELSLALAWTPTSQAPRPVSVFPFYVDVHLRRALDTNTFDLPPGRSSTSYEFEIPVGGRLLAVGAHLHDYGLLIRLEDAPTNRIILRLRAKSDTGGKVLRIEQKLYGVTGRGLKLSANHLYRLVAEYDNPRGSTIKDGGMGHLVGLFQLDHSTERLEVNRSDVELNEDLRILHGDVSTTR